MSASPIYETVAVHGGAFVVREHPQQYEVVLVEPRGNSFCMDAAAARQIADALAHCADAVEAAERAAREGDV